MTNIPKDGLNSGVRITFTAGFVVLLLLMIAFLNLPSPSATRSVPYITIIKIPRIDVFSRPNTIDSLWTGRLEINQRADVLARSPDGEWFKIKYGNGSGWVPSVFAKPSIAPIMLPIDVGSPIPTLIIIMGAVPATQTPRVLPTTIPPTLSLDPTPNLVLGEITFTPPLPFICFKEASVSIEINNLGGGVIPNGKVTISDTSVKRQYPDVESFALFGPIEDHQVIVNDILFGGPVLFGGEIHQIVVTVNPDRSILETNYDDNSREFTYTLQGDC